jgi:hypothetical protein
MFSIWYLQVHRSDRLGLGSSYQLAVPCQGSPDVGHRHLGRLCVNEPLYFPLLHSPAARPKASPRPHPSGGAFGNSTGQSGIGEYLINQSVLV